MIQVKKSRLVFVCLLTLCVCSVIQAQDRTIVISGSVVTPERVLNKGWVVIKDKKISAVSETLPTEENAIWIDTNDIIFPGFIDLHNHPMYAMFNLWDAKRFFNNRYEWRGLDAYKAEIANPARTIQDDRQGYCDIAEFAEVQAITGGTTTLSGMFIATKTFGTTFPDCLSQLAVRKLEIDTGFYSGHGRERVQNMLGVGKDYIESTGATLRQKVAEKKLDLVLIHVSEGKRTDPESVKEFDLLKTRGFLTSTTAVIHGTAFDKSDFAKMSLTDTALIWSPRSNMILYDSTTDVISAWREGVSIALAPDWAPSGSINMLGEIKYAADLNKTTLGGFFSNQQLFEMATSIPARIAHIDDKVGTIQKGLYADLFLLRGDTTRPFDTLVQSKPQDVSLVMVNGVPIYGDGALMSKFKVETEELSFCGETKNLNLEVLLNGKLSDAQRRLESKMEGFKLKLAKVDPCAQ